MKKVLGLLVAAIFSAVSYAQSAGPKIEFKSDVVDYGTITKSDNGKRTFEFTNAGDSPLYITEVRSTSGFSAKWSKDPVLPGKSGSIEIKYNVTPGPIRKTITIQSNAINYPGGIIPLKIKGKVEDKN